MKKLLLLILVIVFASAYSNTVYPSTGNGSKSELLKSESPALPAAKRYSTKSGIVHYKAPMNTTQELYFDNYGSIELYISSIDLGIAKSKHIEIRRDGFIYSYTDGKKEGTKRPWIISDTDYSKADAATLARYKVKDLGTETIAGKSCKKYSAEFGRSPILTWVWNNVMVKSITKMGGKDFIIEAVKIEEIPVDAKMFEIPKAVNFIAQ
jgi:hypothetical protein